MQDVAAEHPNTSLATLPEQTTEAQSPPFPFSRLAARESDTVIVSSSVLPNRKAWIG